MSSHGEYDKQDPHLPIVTFFGVGILVATAITAIWIRGWFDVVSVQETSAKLGAFPNAQWDSLKKQSTEKLNAQVGWSDQAAQTVHIPIARAMELVVKDAKAGVAPVEAPVKDDKTPKKAEPKK